jgi:hypothetical protein
MTVLPDFDDEFWTDVGIVETWGRWRQRDEEGRELAQELADVPVWDDRRRPESGFAPVTVVGRWDS